MSIIKILLHLQHEELSYEGVWVKELAENIGEINNLPVFTSEYKFSDVIEFDLVTFKATRLIKNGGYTPTEIVEYSGSFAEDKAKWEASGYVVEAISRCKLAIASKYTKQNS